MLKVLNENNLISPIQFGFKPEEPCIINQLIPAVHEIFETLGAGIEKRRGRVEFSSKHYEAVCLVGIW